MDLTKAPQSGVSNVFRDYRKGNWTLQETMVLIEAKKMDDERRTRRLGESSERGKPAELRWKWVEDYCWKNGCFRSQNQCNDKWDNLMRDFKRVREYERRVAEKEGAEDKSYWAMEKNERKENNMPSNMLSHIYKALVDVVERKGNRGMAVAASTAAILLTSPPVSGQPPPESPIAQTPSLPPPPGQANPLPHAFPFSQSLPSVDSDTSEYSESPAKRRKRRGGDVGGSSSFLQEVSSAISKSASIIAQAIESCEEIEERRHKQVLNLHEKMLQIEESKVETSRQGMNGLVDAVNKLANSILALAANKHQPTL